jgi:hypothetical protein
MQSKAKTVSAYLKELPADRRRAIGAVREVILENLPEGYEETMNYGMIGYFVPHRLYPKGYHCDPSQPLPFAGLASQKNYMSLYMMTLYGPLEDWFRDEFRKSGKKLDMGKCCVRFKRLEDLPLDVVGRAIAKVPVDEFITHYDSVMQSTRASRANRSRTAKRSVSKKRPAARANTTG